MLVTAAALALFVYIGVMVPLLPRLIEEQLGGNEIDIGINLAVFSLAAIMIRPSARPIRRDVTGCAHDGRRRVARRSRHGCVHA